MDKLTEAICNGVLLEMEAVNPGHRASHPICDWVAENFVDKVKTRLAEWRMDEDAQIAAYFADKYLSTLNR